MTRVAGPLADAQEPGRRVAASPGGAPFAAAGPEPRRGRGAEPEATGPAVACPSAQRSDDR